MIQEINKYSMYYLNIDFFNNLFKIEEKIKITEIEESENIKKKINNFKEENKESNKNERVTSQNINQIKLQQNQNQQNFIKQNLQKQLENKKNKN
jgi:hypothetical protein